jgi:NADH-quinone oxidoreductase subunit J
MVTLVFILFSIIALGGGVLVVTQRNLVRAAGALVLSLFGVAGLYALLEVGFLAAVQILIYIGAIAILIIFAVMLTRRLAGGDESGFNSQWAFALGAAVVVLGLMVFVINSAWPFELRAEYVPELAGDSTKALGMALVDPQQFMVPFEIASVLLLGAMIGAIVIARDKSRFGEMEVGEQLDADE